MKQMNGLDRLFINVETSRLPMDMFGILLLDPSTAPDGHDFTRFRAEMAAKVHRLPLFTRRAVWAPFGAGHEHWIVDPEFDIDRHLKHVGAPAPHDLSALCRLAVTLADEPMDKSRPLWQMFYVDGLADGGVALLLRLHHAAIDGVGGAEMLRAIFDDEPMPFDADQPIADVDGERVPSPVEMLVRSVPDQITTPFRLAQRVVPIALPMAKSFVAKLGARTPPDTTGSENPSPPRVVSSPPARSEARNLLNRSTSHSKRSLAVATLSMSELAVIKSHFGTTLNDVVLSATSAAVGEYLQGRGEDVTELRIAAPVNVRDDSAETASGNHFAFMMVTVPSIKDPVQRLKVVAEMTRKARPQRTRPAEGTRTARRTTGMVSHVMGLIDVLPSGVWQTVGQLVNSPVVGAVPPIANFVMSNIPGPSDPLYIAGARITHMYGRTMVGAGVGLFIHCLSYGDSLDFGFTALAELVPDPDQIAQGMHAHVAALLDAATPPPPTPRTAAPRTAPTAGIQR